MQMRISLAGGVARLSNYGFRNSGAHAETNAIVADAAVASSARKIRLRGPFSGAVVADFAGHSFLQPQSIAFDLVSQIFDQIGALLPTECLYEGDLYLGPERTRCFAATEPRP